MPRPKSTTPFYVRLRSAIERCEYTQEKAARSLGISPKTLECWLADREKSWHREPHYLMQVGALNRLASQSREQIIKNVKTIREKRSEFIGPKRPTGRPHKK